MTAWLNDLYQRLLDWLTPGIVPEPWPTPVDPPPAPVFPAPERPTTGSAVARSINEARASQGLPPLTEADDLSRVAMAWAGSMAESGLMNHGDFAGRIASVAPNCAAAENIAEGQPDAPAVVQAWLDDPPHRANLLGNYNHLGVGFARDAAGMTYWCADFARID